MLPPPVRCGDPPQPRHIFFLGVKEEGLLGPKGWLLVAHSCAVDGEQVPQRLCGLLLLVRHCCAATGGPKGCVSAGRCMPTLHYANQTGPQLCAGRVVKCRVFAHRYLRAETLHPTTHPAVQWMRASGWFSRCIPVCIEGAPP